MGNEYEVLSDKFVGGKKGDTIQGPVHPALIGSHLKDVSVEEKGECPACQNEPDVAKTKKAKKYTVAELVDHYVSEHPALAPPTGEEE